MTLRIPFVLWTSAPSHHITAINDSRYPSWLLTGASNGITCMWKSKQLKFKQSVVVPEFIMIPSTCSPVLSIACVSLDEHIYAICGILFLTNLFIFSI
jgi:hypothetical protein